LEWQHELARSWSSVRIGAATLNRTQNSYSFQVQVFFGDLDPNAVHVELYAEGKNGSAPVRLAMQRGERLLGAVNGFAYSLLIPATRPAADYTSRVVPYHAGALIPMEAPFICWDDSPAWRQKAAKAMPAGTGQ
jgi:starch phosphorylase